MNTGEAPTPYNPIEEPGQHRGEAIGFLNLKPCRKQSVTKKARMKNRARGCQDRHREQDGGGGGVQGGRGGPIDELQRILSRRERD